MENKPKTSSYKRLKPYIKGFQIPFVLAIFGALFQRSLQLLDQINLKKLPILLLRYHTYKNGDDSRY